MKFNVFQKNLNFYEFFVAWKFENNFENQILNFNGKIFFKY